MATHKFCVGQNVRFVTTTVIERHAPGGDYKIVRQLPEANGEFYYRIKSVREPHERVVKESQLRKSFDA